MESNLVCVQFPGIVKNVEKAVECLGGIKNIAEANLETNKKRLGLSFQPDNPCIKKVFADVKSSCGVLIKVKVKKIKVNDTVKREVISTSIVGRVNKMFKFEDICNIQYLPVHEEEPGGSKTCLLDDLIPTKIEKPEFFNREMPPFLVPQAFSRIDKPFPYRHNDRVFTLDPDNKPKDKQPKRNPYRPFYFNLIDEVPTEPNQKCVEIVKSKCRETGSAMTEAVELIKQKFEERPIWSMNSINFHSKVKKTLLKLIVPSIAYFMSGGPWGKLWVRYGYDPRKDPSARFYQGLDFRLRSTAGVKSLVGTRDRDTQYKLSRCLDEDTRELVPEGSAVFRPGVAVTQRQLMYQYCDIHIPEVSSLLEECVEGGWLCHGALGWLPARTAQLCRDHVFRYAKQTLFALNYEDVKFERASSDEEQNSDADADDAIKVTTTILE